MKVAEIIKDAQKALVIGHKDQQETQETQENIGTLNSRKVVLMGVLAVTSVVALVGAVAAAIFASYIAAGVCAATFVAFGVSTILASRIQVSDQLLTLIQDLSNRVEELYKKEPVVPPVNQEKVEEFDVEKSEKENEARKKRLDVLEKKAENTDAGQLLDNPVYEDAKKIVQQLKNEVEQLLAQLEAEKEKNKLLEGKKILDEAQQNLEKPEIKEEKVIVEQPKVEQPKEIVPSTAQAVEQPSEAVPVVAQPVAPTIPSTDAPTVAQQVVEAPKTDNEKKLLEEIETLKQNLQTETQKIKDQRLPGYDHALQQVLKTPINLDTSLVIKEMKAKRMAELAKNDEFAQQEKNPILENQKASDQIDRLKIKIIEAKQKVVVTNFEMQKIAFADVRTNLEAILKETQNLTKTSKKLKDSIEKKLTTRESHLQGIENKQ